MIRIEVTSKIEVKHVIAKKGSNAGKAFEIPEQHCWAHLPGDPHPTRVIRAVGRDAEALKPGMYMLDPTSIYVDRYGNLAIKSQFAVRELAAVTPSSKVA
jgi:hypothetical protein